MNNISKTIALVVAAFCGMATQTQEKIVKPDIFYMGTPRTCHIANITIGGVEGYEDYMLLAISGLSKGQTITVPGSEVTDAVKRYWKHGLFSEVAIAADSIVGDSIYLNIRLALRPRVSTINYSGLKKSEQEDMENKLGLLKGGQVTPNILDRARILAKKYFDDKGFKNAVISIRQRDDVANKNSVILDIDIDKKQKYVSHRLVITKPEINGKTFGQIHFSTIYGVNVTRVTRNGMDLFADRNLRLQVGDRILVTGTEENVEAVKRAIGSSVKRLDHPNVGAIFFGIMLGILVGQIPLGMGMKLGLAGGPLVVAILIGAFGYRYKINTYTSTSANLMLREVGLLLFLSSVGIQAGAHFWETIMAGGLTYVWTGFLITIIPILIMGVVARKVLKLNYFTLMGLIAGSNTDPPALAFANQTAGNDAPAVGYSTVYPLAMFLRILVAQVVLLVFLS